MRLGTGGFKVIPAGGTLLAHLLATGSHHPVRTRSRASFPVQPKLVGKSETARAAVRFSFSRSSGALTMAAKTPDPRFCSVFRELTGQDEGLCSK